MEMIEQEFRETGVLKDRAYMPYANSKDATYHYDAAGRLDYLENFNGTITDYGYDAANRLTSLDNKKSDNSIIASYSFPVLDGVGNRMQAEINEPLMPVLTPEQTGYTYNEKKNRLETAGATTFGYDLEGQIANKGPETYTFDYEHRLSTISGTASSNYFYDGTSNRLKATRNGETTYYIHDLNNNVLGEADGNKNITRLYIHGQGLIGMVTSTGSVYSYHFNAIGSTVAMTDQGQNVVNAYAYGSFGGVLNQVEAIPQPFKYVGQYGVMAESCELTAECFLYMRARYYDPKVGRFISEDPIGFEGGDVNLSNYVGANPVNFIDPMGLAPKFPYTPPSGCEYYKKKCEEKECEKDKDDYACKVYKCCQAFGDDPTSNCIRGCLIEFDKRNCANLTGEARNRCRRLAHWDCYDRCLGHSKGAGGLLLGPPAACQDAMDAVGGMGF